MSGVFVSGSIDPSTLYTKQECIGGGSFGKVYKGIDRRTGQLVAIKVIDVENAEDEVDDIIGEISILSGLNSPYVTRYHGSYLHGSDLWIVMEFCSGGSCADLLKPGPLNESEIAIILKELLMGLVYLHDDNKLHRDIKAANVLVSANGQVKLADFGVSGQLSATMTKKNTFVGTPFWMAPEVIKQSGYDHKADIWSLGITALELANSEPPYADIHPMKVLFLIPRNPPPTLSGNFSQNFKDFIDLCVRKHPHERPSARQLLATPFIRKAGKPGRLQELIARYHEWKVKHPKDGDESSDEATPQKKAPVNEDLWDFGTVRPAGGARGQGLKPMTDAGANARNASPSRKPMPPPHRGIENEFGSEDTVRHASPPPSPTKRLAPLQKPISIGAAANVPLPQSPEKSSGSQFNFPPPVVQETPRKSPVPALFSPHPPTRGLQTPTKQTPLPQPRRQTPLARDYDDYIQRSIAQDMDNLDITSPQRNATPTRASVLPKIDIPEIPPFRGGPNSRSASASSHSPNSSARLKRTTEPSNVGVARSPVAQQQPLPALPGQKPLPPLTTQQPLYPPSQKPLPTFDPKAVSPPSSHSSSSSRPTSSSTNDPFGGPFPSDAALERQKQQQQKLAQPSTSNIRNGNPLPPSSSTSQQSPAPALRNSFGRPKKPTQQQQPTSPTSPTSPSPPPEITALSGVILPALDAALQRRTYNLSLKNKEESATAFRDPSLFMERRKERAMQHEAVKRLVGEIAGRFRELDRVDEEGLQAGGEVVGGVSVDGVGAGMGGGVSGFLEGFLEEVLVRVEACDDY
ncbi:kinase-like domain-containing protein [Lophiotrema nucula]|uniref:non-specific serine/threonine protein kinase n=1 Tax=Lophiotrema nucula TaxID=690887 RepID=A0A6A5YZM9_9PLEO|nr:kinase-like domain-containing protein [Lophiotrema nucula]